MKKEKKEEEFDSFKVFYFLLTHKSTHPLILRVSVSDIATLKLTAA